MVDKAHEPAARRLEQKTPDAAPATSEADPPPLNGKDLETTLKAVAAEWRATFDAVSEGIVVLSLDGRIQRMNRSALLLASGAYRDHIGKTVDHIGPRAPWQQISRLREDLLACHSSRSIVANDPRSEKSWVLSGSFIATTEGLDERIIVVLHDQTERVRLEESLRCSERLSAMGNLVAGVSHEVRNPLFGISATLDAFESRHGDRPENASYLEVLRSQVDRMTRLMEDLFEYGRPARLVLEPNELRGVVEEAIQVCTPLAQQEQVLLEAKIEPDLEPVRMDQNRLVSVFSNLIENAVQHSPQAASVRIEVTARELDHRGWAHCTVTDSGSGIRDLDPARVFEPFFSRRHGGTGLGLAIVHRIVQEHSGRIALHERSSSGTRVEVWLPFVDSTEASVP